MFAATRTRGKVSFYPREHVLYMKKDSGMLPKMLHNMSDITYVLLDFYGFVCRIVVLVMDSLASLFIYLLISISCGVISMLIYWSLTSEILFYFNHHDNKHTLSDGGNY